MFMRNVSFLAVLALASGCLAAGAETPEVGDAEASSSLKSDQVFVDARSFFTESADIDAWYGLTRNLKNEFDDVCGDTFCEGDYSNYETLSFTCSVEAQAGTIGKCVWVFAASQEEIVPSTGTVKVHARTWRCAAPLSPATPIRDFVQALSAPGEEALYAKLPNTDQSIYDGLVDCL